MSWTWPMSAKWTDLQLTRDVYVVTGRIVPDRQALIDILYRAHHMSLDQIELSDTNENRMFHNQISQPGTHEPTKDPQSQMEIKSVPHTQGQSNLNYPDKDNPQMTITVPNQKRRTKLTKKLRQNHYNYSPADDHPKHNDANNSQDTECKFNHSLCINGIMKAYQAKDAFTGAWDEDLENFLSVFKTI